MKTDKELLEMAARAAGYTHLTEWSESISDYDSEHYGEPALHAAGSGGQCQSFNALKDDGDALRLAVKLQFDVIPKWGENCVCIIGGGDHFEEPQQPDIYAAMRRAIVRAAAAIGEKL